MSSSLLLSIWYNFTLSEVFVSICVEGINLKYSGNNSASLPINNDSIIPMRAFACSSLFCEPMDLICDVVFIKSIAKDKNSSPRGVSDIFFPILSKSGMPNPLSSCFIWNVTVDCEYPSLRGLCKASQVNDPYKGEYISKFHQPGLPSKKLMDVINNINFTNMKFHNMLILSDNDQYVFCHKFLSNVYIFTFDLIVVDYI